jgi:hypothetical protein
LCVSNSQNEHYTLYIFDVVESSSSKTFFILKTEEIDLSNISKGVYYLRVVTGFGNIYVEKITVQ